MPLGTRRRVRRRASDMISAAQPSESRLCPVAVTAAGSEGRTAKATVGAVTDGLARPDRHRPASPSTRRDVTSDRRVGWGRGGRRQRLVQVVWAAVHRPVSSVGRAQGS